MLPPDGAGAGLASRPAVAQGWREIVGDAGRIVSLEHFGASADYQTLYSEFGITAEAVAPGRPATASPPPSASG